MEECVLRFCRAEMLRKGSGEENEMKRRDKAKRRKHFNDDPAQSCSAANGNLMLFGGLVSV